MTKGLNEKIINATIGVAKSSGFKDIERVDDDVLIARWFDDETEVDEIHFIKVYVREKAEGFGEDPTITTSEVERLIDENAQTIAQWDALIQFIRFSAIVINVITKDKALVKLIRNADVVKE